MSKDRLPDVLEEYIRDLPSSLVNNGREIARKAFERILKLHPVTAQRILRREWGVDLDIDFTPGKDDGEPPGTDYQQAE